MASTAFSLAISFSLSISIILLAVSLFQGLNLSAAANDEDGDDMFSGIVEGNKLIVHFAAFALPVELLSGLKP